MRKLALEGGLLRAAAYVSLVIVGILWLNPSSRAFAEVANTDVPYRDFSKVFPLFGHQIPSRVAIWVVAQLHLYLAAFVLAVPIFALIIEYIGYKTGDKKYDRLAYEFTKLLSVSFSLTATLGAVLTFMLIVLYPKFTIQPTSPQSLDRRSSTMFSSFLLRPGSSTRTITAGENSRHESIYSLALG